MLQGKYHPQVGGIKEVQPHGKGFDQIIQGFRNEPHSNLHLPGRKHMNVHA